jgi:hypothetical protein
MLATPGPNGDAVLESAIVAAAAAGLLAPRHHVVVLQQIHEDFCVKVGVCGGGGVLGCNMHAGEYASHDFTRVAGWHGPEGQQQLAVLV